jgi:hypothetical protein
MSKWHGGKGSNTRPLGVSSEQFESNWDNIFGKKQQSLNEVAHDDMWTHRCPVEGLLSIAKGERCSWCGAFEESK